MPAIAFSEEHHMIEQHQRPQSVQEESKDVEGSGMCPVCRRSDVTSKVSSVARANRGRLALEDGSWAAYESELGSLLSRPSMPELLPLSTVVVAFAVGWLLLALDLVVVAGLRAQTAVSIPEAGLSTATYLGIGWFGLLIPAVAIARYTVRKQSVDQALPAWRHASRRWQSFRYCARDDLVFIPGEGSGVAPEHIAILYGQDAYERVVVLSNRQAQT
jgi:hypothetical protein